EQIGERIGCRVQATYRQGRGNACAALRGGDLRRAGADAGGQAAAGIDSCGGSVGRSPEDIAGDVLGSTVAVGAGGGKLLRRVQPDGWGCGSDGNGYKGRRSDLERYRGAGHGAKRSGDLRGASHEAVGQPGACADRSRGGNGRSPSHASGDICRAEVAIGSYGRELLRGAQGNRRRCGSHADGLQSGIGDVQRHGWAGDAERGRNVCRTRLLTKRDSRDRVDRRNRRVGGRPGNAVRDVLSGAVAESACGRELQGSSLGNGRVGGCDGNRGQGGRGYGEIHGRTHDAQGARGSTRQAKGRTSCLGELGDGVGSLIQKNGDGVIRLVEDREILRADEAEIGSHKSDGRLADGELLHWNRGANSARIGGKTRAAEAAGE